MSLQKKKFISDFNIKKKLIKTFDLFQTTNSGQKYLYTSDFHMYFMSLGQKPTRQKPTRQPTRQKPTRHKPTRQKPTRQKPTRHKPPGQNPPDKKPPIMKIIS